MSYRTFSLHQLGWQPAFAASLTLADFEAGYPARVVGVQGDYLSVLSSRGRSVVDWPQHDAVAGDWVWLAQSQAKGMRRLARHSLLVGLRGEVDAGCATVANLDALCLLASCADVLDETLLTPLMAQALEAGIVPVLVLLHDDARVDAGLAVAMAQRRFPGTPVMAVMATQSLMAAPLAPWLAEGRTIAFHCTSAVAAQWLLRVSIEEAHGLAAIGDALRPTHHAAWLVDVSSKPEVIPGLLMPLQGRTAHLSEALPP